MSRLKDQHGQLSALHDDIENENLLIAPIIVREAAINSQIEGTDITVSVCCIDSMETLAVALLGDQGASSDRDPVDPA
ncbi:Fic/DOC family N-terminal domain-containing protein [Natrialba taiwanensis]|uniref:Fic/DOC N-terminal domain-containing protein n=1 Tax=Natrialba taiwanensis DSM 12281 TaxID=1230458 RepID=L9ZRR6_9EURY|nr:Fic/DOC family N-terminal domain-containing protein [Natrialba taiwanensis]ELY88781.1 hypothetical protein C484_14338 [Natrialba taiwanensis DSM 12281]